MKDRSKVLFGFVMLLMVVGIIGFSYALFTTKVEKKGALNIIAGDVSCPINIEGENNNQITLQGGEEKEVTVTLTNQSLIDVHSEITYSGNNVEVLSLIDNESKIELQSLEKGKTETYILKLKNNGTEPEVVTLNGRCGLSNKDLKVADGETKVTENYGRTEANAPKLVEGLIPVVYDEKEKAWVKADVTKKWYNYNNQEWANAVTIGLDEDGISATKRTKYQEAEAGTPILMDDINTMWVWIPRYEYNYVSIMDTRGKQSSCFYDDNDPDFNCYLNPGAIDINFISGTSTKASDEKKYIIHPAFTFGEDELTGIWYGKFETGNQEQISNSADGDTSELTAIIKPNVSPWNTVSVSNSFYASRKMQTEKYNVYGFANDLKSYDTHMSKNVEWGAVAYLSQSKYGKYYTDKQEISIHGCRTGCASACNQSYETPEGQKASTTGNITGVYDMGGWLEYVMGALADGNDPSKPGIYYAGFTNDGDKKVPETKYYDVYPNINSNDMSLSATACNGGVCYGHALSETAGWYGDHGYYVQPWSSWIGRGEDGIFSMSNNAGLGLSWHCFRLVLVPIGA